MKTKNITVTTILLLLASFPLSPAALARPTPTDVNVVNPTNSPVPVRDVDTAARIPFFANIQLVAMPGELEKSASVDIPAGKMLVVEFTSAFIAGEEAINVFKVSITD